MLWGLNELGVAAHGSVLHLLQVLVSFPPAHRASSTLGRWEFFWPHEKSLPVSGGSTLKIKVSGLSASTSIAEASILQKFQCTCHVAFTFTLTSFYKPSWSAYLCFKCSSMFFAPWKPFDKTSHLKNKENKHTENSFRQTSINACLSTNRDSLHASIDPQSFTWLPKWRLQLTATPRKALTEYSCTVAVSLNN